MCSKRHNKLKTAGYAFVLFVLAACAPTAAPTELSPIAPNAALACATLNLPGGVRCLDVSPSVVLLQSDGRGEYTFWLNGTSITLNGTLYAATTADYALSIATLEGVSVVAAVNTTRIIQPGAQVSLLLTEGIASSAPTFLYPFDIGTIRRAPLDRLPREIRLPVPIAPPPNFTPYPSITPTSTNTPTPTNTPTTTATTAPGITPSPQPPTDFPTDTPSPVPTICAVREDWVGLYTIQRGDTLSRVAQRFNLSLEALQAGNCIDDPNLIKAGQVLYLPADVFLTTPNAPLGSFEYRADESSVQAGACTTVRWAVPQVSAVYFEQALVNEIDGRQVCPEKTTTYTLLIVYTDGTQKPYTLTLSVTP